ncbi:ribosome biogenesis GTPase Der [Candidatus Uhrbacteria bacterium]|nr:ribosome biogenesis GTPase Der [Candidatus Uhrbacteria bacterium]
MTVSKKKSALRPAEFAKYPIVALVGRVNVGKSTLFNTLLEQKKAVVSAIPGTTRDVNYGLCSWRGRVLALVDTGGFVGKPSPGSSRINISQSDIDEKVEQYGDRVVSGADMILFLGDNREGPTSDDRLFLSRIRRISNAPILLVANKADRKRDNEDENWSEWQRIGLGEPLRVSAVTGRGTGDLLDEVVARLSSFDDAATQDESAEVKVAIVGRTNAGKSSILNRIIGQERVIVSPHHHTTREPQDTFLEYKGMGLRIIDTVGMRRKSKITSKIDREGFARSIRSIEKADIVILVLESMVTPSKQESRLLSIARDAGAGVLIVVNKWDLVEGKTAKSAKTYQDFFHNYFKTAQWVPILFISALAGQRTARILDCVMAVLAERSRTVGQHELDMFLKDALAHQKPQWIRGRKKPIVHGIAQRSINPPTFLLGVNERLGVSYSYLRYLEHRMRDRFGFEGTPVRIYTDVQDMRKEKI